MIHPPVVAEEIETGNEWDEACDGIVRRAMALLADRHRGLPESHEALGIAVPAWLMGLVSHSSIAMF